MRGAYQGMTSAEIDILASETSASMSTQHPDYARLAARICVSHNHKITPETFSENVSKLAANFTGSTSKLQPETKDFK